MLKLFYILLYVYKKKKNVIVVILLMSIKERIYLSLTTNILFAIFRFTIFILFYFITRLWHSQKEDILPCTDLTTKLISTNEQLVLSWFRMCSRLQDIAENLIGYTLDINEENHGYKSLLTYSLVEFQQFFNYNYCFSV